MKKRLLIINMVALFGLTAMAQSGTNSPYSQYGLGVLSEQSQGFSRGMNGVGLALRKGNIVNSLNPASYSAVDSLTMIFDVGLMGQTTQFKEGGSSVKANNANFEYAVASFRLMPHVGMSFGVLPYSNVGYSYTATTYLAQNQTTLLETYQGSGGLHQMYLGAGWHVFGPLSVGANVSYLWGTYNRSVTNSGSTEINTLKKTHSASVNSYKIDFGVQWQQPLGKEDQVTLGLTMGLGHKLGADPQCEIVNANLLTSTSDTTIFVADNALELPMSFGAGVAWSHKNKWLVEVDAKMEKWGSVVSPNNDAGGVYKACDGLLKDRYSVNIGADYVPAAMSRTFLNRVHYRLGAGYSTPYYYINGKDGPKELSVSAGFGIPLQNAYNNRSVLNVSAQWVRTSAPDFIRENTFRINIGLTFNERWFAKWKVD